jgi:hypothetical protein
MPERILVRLQIVSDSLTCEELKSQIGLSPSRSMRKGELIPSTLLVHKSNVWELVSGLQESASIQDQLMALFFRFEPVANRIAALSKIAEITVSCVVYCTRQPDLYVKPELIQKISKIGAGIDIDVYWTESGPEEVE